MKLPCSPSWSTADGTARRFGFTLVELMIVMAILTTIVTVAFPMYRRALEAAETTVAIRGIEELQAKIELFAMTTGSYPTSLDQLDGAPFVDPWGNPYQFLNFETIQGNGNEQMRKDKFLVPLNTKYDLFSMGPDGKSVSPLTAKASRDDIVRANDGGFIGVASAY